MKIGTIVRTPRFAYRTQHYWWEDKVGVVVGHDKRIQPPGGSFVKVVVQGDANMRICTFSVNTLKVLDW